MTEKTTQDPTEGPTADTISAPVAPTPPPSPPSPSFDARVYDTDGKTWQSKFHGAQGRLMQVQAQKDTEVGTLQQQVETFQGKVIQKEAEISTLKAQTEQLTSKVQTIPQLQGELDNAKKKANWADKLDVLMGHPRLLSMQVEEQQAVEGQDEPVTVTVNPFMRLIESTTLSGDALERELVRLSAALPLAGITTPVVEGAAPAPVQPAATDDLDILRAQAMEWHEKSIAGEPNAKDKEREAWGAFYDAQSKTTS